VTDERRGRSPLRRQEGFTIVEVLLAMVLLVVGVLGMLVMVEGSFTSTSRTTAREGATNLVREVIERSREVPYAQTTTNLAPAALAAALPENPTVHGSSFEVRRRNFDYTITVTACSIDDPSDGAGVGDNTFCFASPTTGPPVTPPPSGISIGPNVLGLPVSLAVGGSLVDTVCAALGNPEVIASITGTVSDLTGLSGNGAQLTACPAGSAAGTIGFDARPDDLRRIRVRADWTPGTGPASTLTQTTLVTTPA
jgi:Tfp pilus assembly protein PilV